MKKRNLLFSLAVLCSPLGIAVRASEIPPGLDSATVMAQPDANTLAKVGLAADQAQALDLVELAEVEKTDPNQKGGDAIVTVVVIAAIVVLVYIAIQHMDHHI